MGIYIIETKNGMFVCGAYDASQAEVLARLATSDEFEVVLLDDRPFITGKLPLSPAGQLLYID